MAPYIPTSKAYTLYRSPHPITCHPASAQVFSVTRILSHKSSHLFWKIPLEGASNVLSQRCLSVDSYSPLRLCRTNVCQLHEDGDSNYGASSATSLQVLFLTQISKFLAISHMTSLLECDSQNQPKSCEWKMINVEYNWRPISFSAPVSQGTLAVVSLLALMELGISWNPTTSYMGLS